MTRRERPRNPFEYHENRHDRHIHQMQEVGVFEVIGCHNVAWARLSFWSVLQHASAATCRHLEVVVASGRSHQTRFSALVMHAETKDGLIPVQAR